MRDNVGDAWLLRGLRAVAGAAPTAMTDEDQPAGAMTLDRTGGHCWTPLATGAEIQRARARAAVVVLTVLGACARDTAVDFTITMERGGHTRTAQVHLPPAVDGGAPLPVAFNFHGYSATGQQQADYSALNTKADELGFATVHPNGVHRSWNGGACCGRAQGQDVDDVGFVDALLEELPRHFPVDQRRVYATGMSNGAFLSYRLACERANRFAAIVTVAGVNGMASCAPSRPVPLLHFHGTEDRLVDYQGTTFVGVRASVEQWPGRMGCTTAARETFRQGDAVCETFDPCNGGAEATLCTIEEGGHTWPGAAYVPGLGRVTQELDASRQALEFFARFALP
jgi:polyhydroxybutyrate depolymerase